MDLDRDFRDFVVTRQRSLLRAAWLLTGDWASAEDLVQTALARTWKRWDKVRAQGEADPYVHAALLYCWRTSRRRFWHREAPYDVLPDQAAREIDRDLQLVLHQAVKALAPRQREVLALRYLGDLDEAATAKAMGCSVGTVKSQTSKALAALRNDPSLHDARETR